MNAQNTETAYFAGGCFWGIEYWMKRLDGVLSVRSGYMGGSLPDPTYEEVSSGRTGHAETVEVAFDPAMIDYREVARRFFEIHDPTEIDRQGPDIGPQYRSAVFYTDENQKRIVGELIDILRARGYDVRTGVVPAEVFYKAEDYHQDYYDRSGGVPYCHIPVDRFGDIR
ncbi:MAG: peptide-methionine (S)-S-oxide reductase MsrA [Candidatus Moranbacteria bacterium]|nr:peptide-methionine (S)-S-oxide reductase MsrA [Candidatus Moranbacteria bacterium]